MYVFREGRRIVSVEDLRRALAESLSGLARFLNFSSVSPVLLECLLRAGELECALADCAGAKHEQAALITDGLAAQLLSQKPKDFSALLELLSCLPMPAEVTISAPEGFAYYALHPLQYARLVESLAISATTVAVVGIRSIGTTLSAVVKAAAERRGLPAERITVRPSGHPYDRVTHFSDRQRDWVRGQQAKGAQFLVVDEGPGLSGSSFLSVAEALVQAGVPAERVTLLCARQPDLTALCARDVAGRAQRFTWCAVPPNSELPEDAGNFVGAGRWRTDFVATQRDWPASWTSMERAKFLSRDGRRLFKFEGLGHYASVVHARACTLHEAGFSPQVASQVSATGYAEYLLVPGASLHGKPATANVIDGIARYCAFRARTLQRADARQYASNREHLELMLLTNLTEEFGSAPDVIPDGLKVECPVIADGRMQPWEWATNGELLTKFDAVSHGDDHFFPGPTDIAWDLAGAVVEFSLHNGNKPAIAAPLLEKYEKYSGDDARSRLPAYLLAYSAFRMGYCKMAAEALRESEEEPRLRREYLLYREFAIQLLARSVAA